MIYTEKYKAKKMLRAIFLYRPSSSSSILPYVGVEFLQVSSIKSPWKTFPFFELKLWGSSSQHRYIKRELLQEIYRDTYKEIEGGERGGVWLQDCIKPLYNSFSMILTNPM